MDVSHFQLGSIQSVLLSVSQGDWLASFDLREAYIPVTVHPASRPFLRFLFRDTVYQFQALCFGLSTSPQVMAPVSPHTFPGSAVSVGRLRFRLFQGFSVGGTHLTAAIYSRRISVMRLAYREPVAVASRRSFFASSPSSGRLAFFLTWLASFLAANWDCGPSSSASIVHGTVRIWRLQS